MPKSVNKKPVIRLRAYGSKGYVDSVSFDMRIPEEKKEARRVYDGYKRNGLKVKIFYLDDDKSEWGEYAIMLKEIGIDVYDPENRRGEFD